LVISRKRDDGSSTKCRDPSHLYGLAAIHQWHNSCPSKWRGGALVVPCQPQRPHSPLRERRNLPPQVLISLTRANLNCLPPPGSYNPLAHPIIIAKRIRESNQNSYRNNPFSFLLMILMEGNWALPKFEILRDDGFLKSRSAMLKCDHANKSLGKGSQHGSGTLAPKNEQNFGRDQ
jgi:hypothetical protein